MPKPKKNKILDMGEYCYSINILKENASYNFFYPDEYNDVLITEPAACPNCVHAMFLNKQGNYYCPDCGFGLEDATPEELEVAYEKATKVTEEIFGKKIKDISMAVGKDNPIEIKVDEDLLSSMTSHIQRQFSNKSEHLHFFFVRLDRYTQRQFCLQSITGLPSFHLRPIKTKYGYDVGFDAVWSADRGDKIGEDWDSIPGKHKYRAYQVNVRGFMHLPQVKAVNVYDWGFEIIAHGGISMFGVMQYALNQETLYKRVEDMASEDNWSLPIKPELRASKATYSWIDSDPDKVAEIDKLIAESTGASEKKQIQNVGQRKVEIDIDG